MYWISNGCSFNRMYTNKIKIMKNLILISLSIFLLSACTSHNEEELYGSLCETENLSYASDIEEIIQTSCATAGCHVAGTGRNVYDSYDNLKLDVDNGTVLAKVITDATMPPGGIDDCYYEKIKIWLDEGAKE